MQPEALTSSCGNMDNVESLTMPPKTKSQIWQMRARELRDAAANANDPVARDTYLNQARKFSRRARRENVALEPVTRTHALPHDSPFRTQRSTDRAWPWLGAISLTVAAAALALTAL